MINEKGEDQGQNTIILNLKLGGGRENCEEVQYTNYLLNFICNYSQRHHVAGVTGKGMPVEHFPAYQMKGKHHRFKTLATT